MYVLPLVNSLLQLSNFSELAVNVRLDCISFEVHPRFALHIERNKAGS